MDVFRAQSPDLSKSQKAASVGGLIHFGFAISANPEMRQNPHLAPLLQI